MKRKRLLFAAIALVAGALNINAQEEDYTSYLTNPDMSSKEGWTMTGNWGGPEGQTGYMCLENYAGWGSLEQTSYSLTQNITLPSGKYRAESNAFYRYGLTWNVDPSKSYAYFIATTPAASFKQIIPTLGSASVRVIDNYANSMTEASQEFAAGNYKSTIEFALEGESEVTFGYEGTHVLKQSWFISGPIKLYRVGDFDFSAWDTQVANAVEAINAKTLPTNAKAYVDGVVAEYNKTYTSVAEYNEAIEALNGVADAVDPLATAYAAAKASYAIPPIAANALAAAVTTADEAAYASVDDLNAQVEPLNTAVAEAQTWIEPYAAFNAAKTDVQALYDVAEYEEIVPGAHDALGAALTAGDAATTVAELTAATSNLKTAAYTYICNANPTGEAKFDLTFMLTNPDLTNLPSWQKADGWYTDQEFPVQNNQVMDTDGQHYYEYWSNNSNPVSGYTVYLKTTLPAGAYQMTAKAKAGWGGGAAEPNGKQNITFSAGDIDGTSITSSGALEDASIEFINNAEQEVKIGLKAHEGNTCNWMGIGYVKLYKVAPKAFIISENETYDNTQEGAGDVELTRTIKAGMNTVVLPFQVTKEDIAVLGGEGAEAYTVKGYKTGTDHRTGKEYQSVVLEKVESILANVPFFLKAAEAGSSFNFTDKTIVAGEPISTVEGAQVVGTYAAITVPQGSFILSGGNFYFVDSEVSLKPTRAYITIAEPVSAKSLNIDIDEATAINAIESEIANAKVYDLSGRMIQNPTRGLYIANGKKVLVK